MLHMHKDEIARGHDTKMREQSYWSLQVLRV